MAHLHELRDTDTHFVIDPVTRTISNANDAKNKLMQYDHNSEIMTFEIPQYVDGHDMSQCDKVEVHYINIDSKTKDQSKDVFPCKAAAKTDNDIVFALEDGKLIFCWKVSGNATVYSGNLNFLVRFACIDDEGKICYKWHTDIFKGITISDGINNTEAVAETYSDVLEQWKKELEDAAGSGSGAASLADWVKQPEKPTYTASEVGALPDTTKIPSKTSDLQNDSGFLTEHQDLSGYALKSEVPKSASDVGADAAGTAESKVSVHNTATDSHNDIRELISGLTQRLNALADSDDTTLDQMSEVIAYIKSNKSLIDAITTSKVSVTDIIDNLTTNASNKPLSAAQGVALKALIDAITTVELDETLTDNTKAAPADVVGKLKGDLSDETNRATERENEIEKLFTMPTKEAVNTWLDEHPEATTTVQDHSLSIEKMVVGTLGYVTPEMFGAKGDGVTDDTQAFIECVKSNRVIKIAKSYKIGSITFAEKLRNVQFVGYGGSIDGSMSFNDVENFKFDKVDFISTLKENILSFSKVNGLVVSNCLFSNSNSEWGSANSSLIYVNSGTENAIKHITIKNSRFTTNYSVNQNNNFKCAIKIFNSNTDLFYSNFIDITGNTFFDSAFIGVECRTLSDVIIANNIFDDIKNTNTYGNPLVSCASTYNTTISNNIFNSLDCGIEITGNDFSVLGNVFKNKVGTDGWIITTGKINRAIIDNNIFNYGKISLGINDVETNDIVFSNNKSKGFAIEIGGTGVKGLVIRDNVMTGSEFHLYAVNYTVSNVTIMNNIFSSDIGTSSLIRFNSNQKINELTIYNNVTDGKQFTNNEVLNDIVKTISGCGTNVGGFSNDTYMFSSSNITEFSIKVPSNSYKGLHRTLASIKASMYNNNSVPYYGEWNMSFGSYDTAQTPALSKIDGNLPDLSVKSCVLSDDGYIITLGFAEQLSSSVDIYFESITFSNDTKGGILSVYKVS